MATAVAVRFLPKQATLWVVEDMVAEGVLLTRVERSQPVGLRLESLGVVSESFAEAASNFWLD